MKKPYNNFPTALLILILAVSGCQKTEHGTKTNTDNTETPKTEMSDPQKPEMTEPSKTEMAASETVSESADVEPSGNEGTSPENNKSEFTNRKPFKYTISTNSARLCDRHRLCANNSNDVEIVVSVRSFKPGCPLIRNTYENTYDNCNNNQDNYQLKYDLDCEGDGDYEYIGLTESKKCTYKRNSGNHQIWVRGEIPLMWLCLRKYKSKNNDDNYCERRTSNIRCNAFLDEPDDSDTSVISIDDWGDIQWKSMSGFAAYCSELNQIPADSPDLSQVTDMRSMFENASSFNQPLDKWNVSNVINMRSMFEDASSFNQPLEKWDMSNVKCMD